MTSEYLETIPQHANINVTVLLWFAGLAAPDLWTNDDETEADVRRVSKDKRVSGASRVSRDSQGAGRGPWCGRGPMRLPPQPLKRLSDLGDNDPDKSPRSSILAQRLATHFTVGN